MGAYAFSVSAQQQRAPSYSPDSAAPIITLGQSAVPLDGPWRFQTGDSPTDSKTGQPLWAERDFDDSKWERVDLTPNTGAVDPVMGATGYVPGWTARGHAGYWGYAWYRIRVNLRARPGQQLAVEGPSDIDDVYEVFANGALVGQFGDFKHNPPTAYYSQPMRFLLPGLPEDDGNPGSSTEVLAFRVFMMPATLKEQADAGGLHNAPVLGDAAGIGAGYQAKWLEQIRGYAFTALEVPLFVLTAVICFSLIVFDRSDRVYLWMGTVFLLEAASYALLVVDNWTQLVSIPFDQIVGAGLLNALIFACWVMVWWVWFERPRPAWTPRAAVLLALLYWATIVIGQQMITGLVPNWVAAFFLSASVLVRLLFLVLQLWIVFQGIRRQGLEGGMVLPAVILWGIATFYTELLRLHLAIRWQLFGVSIRLVQISNLLLEVVVGLLLLRRLLKSIQRQRQMAMDVKQAQEVQQMILPDARTTMPGLLIESEYRPAREVGGDFFQIIPHKSDGSLLIVAGDVSGKGLKAGMLVALLVGAIRTTVRFNPDPLVVLNELNERLVGRGDAQATCLALRIGADGSARLANAGHMAPYLNDEPVPMEGALPLGMIEGAEFSVTDFRLIEHDRLIVMSDGIAEATDASGKLFGFERLHDLLRTTSTAAAVADAAQTFGQEDDISVICVTRTESPVSHLSAMK